MLHSIILTLDKILVKLESKAIAAHYSMKRATVVDCLRLLRC